MCTLYYRSNGSLYNGRCHQLKIHKAVYIHVTLPNGGDSHSRNSDVRPSVRSSVCLSVTLLNCTYTFTHIVKLYTIYSLSS